MFCSKCGNEVAAQSKFCSKCGQPTNQASNGVPAQQNNRNYILTIHRAKQWFAVNPAVKVVVDENTEYRIDNGSTVNIPVSSGTHNIAFSCSIRNKIVNINVADDVTLNIKWNRVTGSLEVN